MLDIDGVLLPDADLYQPPSRDEDWHLFLDTVSFNQSCTKRINTLCEVTQAKIMLISSWRKYFSKQRGTLFKALVRSGLDSSHLHKDWFIPFRYTSEKPDEVFFMIEALESNPVPRVNLLLIDDQDLLLSLDSFEKYPIASYAQITPDAEQAFSETDLQLALDFFDIK
ncbi:hypothetical protein A3735_15015 [Oleiphilus sp. HI0061]|nr:hypothetical protein A3735_15015 [Oleiphilus sp. HI0061]